MLYYFEIQYFEEIHLCEIIAPVILDLPQDNIHDVRLNPFVIDIVNHPFMKAGIEQIRNHKEKLVDSIYEFNNNAVSNTVQVITCRYQEIPGLSNFRTFSFKIYVDVAIGYFFPYSQIEFTCRNYFDEYERLYQTGCYVKPPHIPNSHVGFENDYYYLNQLPGSVELLRIVDTANQQRIIADSIAANGVVSQISIPNAYGKQIRPLLLNDWILLLIGFAPVRGDIYGLRDVDYFEGVLSRGGNAATSIFVKKESVGYGLMIEDETQVAGCSIITFFYLHELQNMVWNVFHANITLNNQQLTNICQRYNQIGQVSFIIATITVEVEKYLHDNPERNSQAEIVDYLAMHYSISTNEAQSMIGIMHL